MGSGFWIIMSILVLYAVVKLYRGYAEYDISSLQYRQLKRGRKQLSEADRDIPHGNKDESKIETF
ncbi:hypothetical protein ACFQPF_13920 [Fictibacillus iocasae]|uniref:SigE-dependent sporulation protein n=1 Tax=Fictibacillus iocasae TaxID=2715437 RepID=A0ABW2NQP5_9BACL